MDLLKLKSTESLFSHKEKDYLVQMIKHGLIEGEAIKEMLCTTKKKLNVKEFNGFDDATTNLSKYLCKKEMSQFSEQELKKIANYLIPAFKRFNDQTNRVRQLQQTAEAEARNHQFMNDTLRAQITSLNKQNITLSRQLRSAKQTIRNHEESLPIVPQVVDDNESTAVVAVARVINDEFIPTATTATTL